MDSDELRDRANCDLLLKNLSGVSDRSAHFTCAIALVYPDGREVVAEGYIYGEIIDEYRGDNGFGYDPLFLPKGYTRTTAELSESEKNSISHRANALAELLTKI